MRLFTLTAVLLGLTGMSVSFGAQPIKSSGAIISDNAATALWNKILTQCGDAYIYSGSGLYLMDQTKERMIDQPPGDPHGSSGNPLDPTNPGQHRARNDWHPSTGWLWEFKGVTFKEVALPLSQADAFNVVEWKGVFRMESHAWRESDADGHWGPWKETPERDDPGRLKVFAQKLHGEWIYSPSFPSTKDGDLTDPRLVSKIPAADLKAYSAASCPAR